MRLGVVSNGNEKPGQFPTTKPVQENSNYQISIIEYFVLKFPSTGLARFGSSHGFHTVSSMTTSGVVQNRALINVSPTPWVMKSLVRSPTGKIP